MPTCVPVAIGVPVPDGMGGFPSSGPPRWWDTGGPLPAFNTRLDDPRWNGAASITYPDSPGVTSEHSILRALYADEAGQRFLYLSWWVKVDPALTGTDYLLVGFHRPGVVQPIVYKIALPSAAVAVTAAAPGSVTPFDGTLAGGSWSWSTPSGASTPAWMAQTTRVWQTLTTTSTPGSWAVQMRVPVGAGGLDLGSSFKFFSYLRVTTGGTPAVWIHAWPRRSTPLPTSTAFGDPTSSAWETVELSASGACQTGVSLVGWPDIGVNEGIFLPNGASADGSIRVTRTAPHPTNHFFARPLNNTGATIGAQALSASFRIANWGSMASPSAGSWLTIPTGADVRDPNPVAHGAKAELDFAWQLTTVTDQALIDAFVGTSTSPPTRLDHQCVFVELSGPGLMFANRSAFRNMWIVNASSVAADAEISVAGLSPLPSAAQHRDTYIYVQAMNMPAVLDTPIVPPTGEGRGEEPRPEEEPPRGRAGEEPAAYARFGLEPAALGTSVVGPTPMVPIHERVPSYTVHVWHATGEESTEDGVTRQLLEPQTSFGLLVDHKGALYGWDHSLKGAGLIELAPNFYKLAVPEGGAARVTVTIEAHETPRSGNWFWWLEWLIRLIRRFIAWVRKLLGL